MLADRFANRLETVGSMLWVKLSSSPAVLVSSRNIWDMRQSRITLFFPLMIICNKLFILPGTEMSAKALTLKKKAMKSSDIGTGVTALEQQKTSSPPKFLESLT